MAKLPFFQWYPADAEIDADWRTMNMAERGLFISLLNLAWMNDGLSTILQESAAMLGLTVTQFEKLWARHVYKKFIVIDGRLVNPRQEKDRLKAKTKSDRNADAANERWKRNANALRTHCECIANGMLRASDSDFLASEISTSEKEKDEFSDWAEAKMAAHPNKRNYDFGIKKLCERFATDPPAREKFDRNHALWCQTKRWLDKQGAFAPGMSDFLRDHEWEHAPPGTHDGGEDVMEVHERLMAEKRRKTG